MWKFDTAERGRKWLESASCLCVEKWDESVREKRVLCQFYKINLGIGVWQRQNQGAGGQEEERRFCTAWSLPGLIKPSPVPSVVLFSSCGQCCPGDWELWEYLPVSAGALHRSGRGKRQVGMEKSCVALLGSSS